MLREAGWADVEQANKTLEVKSMIGHLTCRAYERER
jgi:hypothetical protein